jgi:hypothetical protein
MTRQLERWAPLGGIIFVVLMVTGPRFEPMTNAS